MEKLKFKLSKSELKALVGLLGNTDFDLIYDRDDRIMVQFISQKVFERLTLKSIKPGNKEVTFTLHPAEAVAMSLLLAVVFPPDPYTQTLTLKLTGIIDQKLLT